MSRKTLTQNPEHFVPRDSTNAQWLSAGRPGCGLRPTPPTIGEPVVLPPVLTCTPIDTNTYENTEVDDYRDNIYAVGSGLDAQRLTLVDELVTTLKAQGKWSDIGLFWWPLGCTVDGALVCLKTVGTEHATLNNKWSATLTISNATWNGDFIDPYYNNVPVINNGGAIGGNPPFEELTNTDLEAFGIIPSDCCVIWYCPYFNSLDDYPTNAQPYMFSLSPGGYGHLSMTAGVAAPNYQRDVRWNPSSATFNITNVGYNHFGWGAIQQDATTASLYLQGEEVESVAKTPAANFEVDSRFRIQWYYQAFGSSVGTTPVGCVIITKHQTPAQLQEWFALLDNHRTSLGLPNTPQGGVLT